MTLSKHGMMNVLWGSLLFAFTSLVALLGGHYLIPVIGRSAAQVLTVAMAAAAFGLVIYGFVQIVWAVHQARSRI